MSGLSRFRRAIGVQTEALSSCFADIGREGKSTSLPPLSAKCNLAPDKKCRPVPAGRVVEPWDYVLPKDDPVWRRFELRPAAWGEADVFYKTLHWKQEDGVCTFEIHAKADVNRDGVFGLYVAGEQFPVGMKSQDEVEQFMMAWDSEEPGIQPTKERPLLPD